MTRMVNTDGFASFIAEQRTKIHNAFKEIEQVQVAYQGAYTRFKTDHDKTLHALVERVEAQNDGLKTQVDARTPTERDIIVKRLVELDKTLLPQLQRQADNLIAQAQKEKADLQVTNPQMNAREEQIKTDIARRQQTLDDLNTQVARLSKGLGFLFNMFKLSALDRERHEAVGHLAGLHDQLSKVRQEWIDLKKMATTEELDWQTQWQALMGQIAVLRQERDYLAQNTEKETRHRAIFYVLDNLKALPAGADAAALQPMIDLNIQTDNFQAALGSVASILGVLKGIDDGLGRMDQSVGAILAEQKRHSAHLGSLNIALHDSVVAFGKTWDDLIGKTKDEKTLATHPVDFVTAMKPFLEERLTQKQIAAFFDTLGSALKDATRNWRGS